jgi:hypothetical protein
LRLVEVAGARSCSSLSLQSEVEISGLAFHSALAVERVETSLEGETMVVRVVLGPARKGLSGRFSYAAQVPATVTRVVFGKKGAEIWRRR